MQIELVLGIVLGPCHLFKTVSLGVDELGVLRDRLVGVPGDKTEMKQTET